MLYHTAPSSNALLTHCAQQTKSSLESEVKQKQLDLIRKDEEINRLLLQASASTRQPSSCGLWQLGFYRSDTCWYAQTARGSTT